MQETAAASNTTTTTSLLSGFPDWVVLDTRARIGHCNNATTAEAKTSALWPIKVSFEIVDPPCLSRCVVHWPDQERDPRAWAMVIGADGAFVLIRVYFPVRDKWMLPDVFVYRADPRAPSLHLVPRPYPIILHYKYKTAVGVLAANSGDTVNQYCSVVVPERDPGRLSYCYSLQVFCTKTMSWSTKVTRLATDLQWYGSGLHRVEPTKVFSIGGGSLAWVDLRHGIMMCDVLDEEPELRLIQLPQLLPSNKRDHGEGLDGSRPPLYPLRDVSFRDGRFSCIEIEYPYEIDDDDTTKPLDFRWRATLFRTSISSGQCMGQVPHRGLY
ncbi:LOW QUALITY PROTEIN: hypothetical protein BDA96_01G098900 [Sorghum bicolor]|uniref:DUF1618 domain-containing protein n=1 Tax=Sorghum bicolor TaxID=4558 RepID=A0A921RXF9_SORBI|nr:LOW QUALITY PROTEIN: hypothetical protein BDA96_01G098900 [Sorghum bicolor]